MYIPILLTGLIAGIFGGFFGLGGGIIMIPILVLGLGFAQHTAQGTALAAMIPPIGLLAALAYWKAGHVNIKAAVMIAATFLIGGWIGGTIAQHTSPLILRKAFAIMLVVIAVKMWLGE